MVYALAEPIIGQLQFDAVVDQVHRRIECEVGEVIEDKCGEKCSQYFNGTNVKNKELVVEYGYYGCIYCINDIDNNVIERENNNKTTTYYTSLENNDRHKREQHTIVEWENTDKKGRGPIPLFFH
jgi:hypothetical protein